MVQIFKASSSRFCKHVSLFQFDFCRSPLTTHMIAIRYEFETPISKLGTNFESKK